MKCVRAENPPCVRCTKTGRNCIIPDSNRSQQAPTIHPSARGPHEFKAPSAAPPVSTAPNDAAYYSTAKHHTHHVSRPSVGRSYTTPSLLVAPNLPVLPSGGRWPPAASSSGSLAPPPNFDYTATNDVGQTHVRSDHVARADASDHSYKSERETTHTVPNDEELCHLSRFFVLNLLVHIPILSELEVSDLAVIVKSKRLLAYSMAYVAARFVPGCRAVRTMLSPTVIAMSRLHLDELNQSARSDEDRWTLLQALAVLYSWAAPKPTDLAAGDADLQLEPYQEILRASIETLALRYSLHISAKEVTELLRSGSENVHHTFAFRKYLYWLWLFTLAHFRSLISQTPPSIREDATITAAAQLLEGRTPDSRARRILARVELCLLWQRAGLRERGLGEWWCVFRNQVDNSSTLAVLSDLDAALQLWHRTWCPSGKQSPLERSANLGNDGAIEFDYHYTRFCIGRYVAEVFQPASFTEALPLNLVMKAAERASTFCRFFLELSPVAKSSVRFSLDTIFTMVASACDYLMQVDSSSSGLNHVQRGHMSTISGVAELLVDLGVDEKYGARLYGQRCLTRVEAMKQGEQTQKHQKTPTSHKRSNTWAGTRSDSQGAQALLSFAGVADDSWSIHGNLGQRGLPNGEQDGLAMGSGDGGGLWTMNYQSADALMSNGHYWTS